MVVLFGVAVVTAGLTLVSESVIPPIATVFVGLLVLAGLSAWDIEPNGIETKDETQRQTLRLRVTEIDPAVAKAITPGETTIEEDLAVTDVRYGPASVVVETDDGTLVEQEHPHLCTATLVATIQSSDRREDGFRGDRLFVGCELRLDLEKVRVDTTIVALGDDATEPTEVESAAAVFDDPAMVSASE